MITVTKERSHGRIPERGAGLVLIIGVVAALAISAATLVVFLANVQHNTADTRQHVKSFTVCEAGLDAGMALLSNQWPASSTGIPTFDATTFRGRFPTNQFPDPSSGQFISVTWYDDPSDTSVNWDADDDGKLWMVSQSNVGSRATRVISQVERSYFKMALPRGIPLWAGGDLYSNGGGNNPKVKVEVPPPIGITTTVHVGGTIEETDVTAGGIAQLTGPAITPLDQVFPQTLVDSLTTTAQSNGRYFTTLAAAEASPVNAVWSPTGGLSGLTVIKPPSVIELKVQGNTTLNSEESPGILIVLGGSTLSWGGTAQYYGVMYCEGPMNTSHGTGDIHGMVIANTDEDMRGTPNILYNDKCIANLDERFPSMARRVRNTWREVAPK